MTKKKQSTVITRSEKTVHFKIEVNSDMAVVSDKRIRAQVAMARIDGASPYSSRPKKKIRKQADLATVQDLTKILAGA